MNKKSKQKNKNKAANKSIQQKSVNAKSAALRNVKYMGALKLFGLYAATLGLLYGAFWIGYYFLEEWGGIAASVLLVMASSVPLIIFRKKMWSALISCLSVSAGIGLAISSFFVVLEVEPSRFFGLVLLVVLAYKSLQSLLMAKVNRKVTLTALFIVLEIVLAIVFFAQMEEDIGLYSQIGFACVVAIFLSFGQLSLYKFGANDMWRTIALSYIIGFAFIVVLVVVLILCFLAEDGSPFEILGGVTFGDVGGTKKNKNIGAGIDPATMAYYGSSTIDENYKGRQKKNINEPWDKPDDMR